MGQIDFSRIESELGVVVPRVFREFIEKFNDLGGNFERWELYARTDEIVAETKSVRDMFSEICESHFLVVGPDGCGNFYAIDASEPDADSIVLLAHDPYGIEAVGTASDFFRPALSDP